MKPSSGVATAPRALGHAFLDFGQHGVDVVGKFGFRNPQRRHYFDQYIGYSVRLRCLARSGGAPEASLCRAGDGYSTRFSAGFPYPAKRSRIPCP